MLFKFFIWLNVIFISPSVPNTLRKPLKLASSLPFPIISAQGSIPVTEVYEPIKISFDSITNASHLLNYTFEIYEGNTLMQTNIVNGKELETGKYTLFYNQNFTSWNSTKKILIKIKWLELVLTSNDIMISSCMRVGYSNNAINTNTYQFKAPVVSYFKMAYKLSEATVNYDYEYVTTTSIKPIMNDYNRYITFSNLSLFIKTSEAYNLDDISVATLRLYDTVFPDTDLIGPTSHSVDIELPVQRKGNWFYIANENRFYQDKYTGTIYETKNNQCGNVMHPFFIPFNATLLVNPIRYCIIFSKIGMLKNTFYIYGEFSIYRNIIGPTGSKFYYQSIDSPLLDVVYEQ